jgi:F420-non-reducing hydrogenase iron-sulfur subunit
VNPERLRIEWISAAEGVRFAEVMNDFAGTLKKLGPLGQDLGGNGDQLQTKLEKIRTLVPYIKIAKREKLTQRLEKQADYDTFYTPDEIDTLLTDLPSYHIDPAKCQACMICLRKCPVHGIEGGKGLIHVIDQELCIRCGTCFEACPERFGAVSMIHGPVPPPIPEAERTIDRKSGKAG